MKLRKKKLHLKLRTNKTASKRLGVTGSGLMTRTTTNAHHLRDNKSRRQKAAAKDVVLVALPDLPKFKRLIPNR